MNSRPTPQPTTSDAALYARLRHQYGPAATFSLDAEFVLPPGITILFGASGSGKTTVLDCLAGLLTPDTGRITNSGRLLFDSDQRINIPAPQRRLGYLFQNLALFPHMTVRQNVEYGLVSCPAFERRQRSGAILERFRIAELADRRPAGISGGERQRVALARALVTDPQFMLLDEPLTALDAGTKSRIIADIRAWNRDHRIPVLYVTHDRSEAYALGDRVIVIENGSVIAQGSPHEVLDLPRMESIAQLAGFENVFTAEVVESHLEQGTMTCRILPSLDDPSRALEIVFAGPSAPTTVEAPLTNAALGQAVRLGVRAGDILVATEPPRGLSARNLLPARVHSLKKEGSCVVAGAECGGASAPVRFVVHLTPRAVSQLGLRQGSPVWLVIKTHSFRVLA